MDEKEITKVSRFYLTTRHAFTNYTQLDENEDSLQLKNLTTSATKIFI